MASMDNIREGVITSHSDVKPPECNACDDISYDPNYYDYLEYPNDDEEYYDYIEGISKCVCCDKVCFLVDGRCKSCFQQRSIKCPCCKCIFFEKKNHFVFEITEGYQKHMYNCNDCETHKNNTCFTESSYYYNNNDYDEDCCCCRQPNRLCICNDYENSDSDSDLYSDDDYL